MHLVTMREEMRMRNNRFSLRLMFCAVILLLGWSAGCAGLPPGYPFKIESLYSVDDPQFVRTMGHLLGPPMVDGNSVQTLRNGDEIFPAMLKDIRAAETSITFESLIYWKGHVGNQFTNALCERAIAGVKVHVLLDAVGIDKIDKKYIERMRKCGCQVEIYNPLRWFDLTSTMRLTRRTHRKLLVIDGKVGYTGGVGIADEWSGHAQDPKHWRDNHYRVTGPVVAHLQSAFLDHWVEANGTILHGDTYFPKIENAGELYAQVFKSGPSGGGESMQLMYLISFSAARKNLRLATAYFVPDDLTIDQLVKARQRGVKVQILVPNELTDVPITRHASRAMWGKLYEAGVEIWEYQETMYHTKLMVVDDLWVSVGSCNLDNRGFRLNGEANLNVLNAEFGAEQARIFDEDLKHARQITYQEWKNRPFGEKLKEGASTILKWQL
jgi:cardiolipin synthase